MRSSPKAMRIFTANGATRALFVSGSSHFFLLLCALLFFVCPKLALTQDAPQAPAASPAPSTAPQSETKETSAEVVAHDEPATFKVNVKLVVVRAVVRDSEGHAVGNLHEEDFQVFDKGKPQIISQFDVEQPGALAAKARAKSIENSGDIPSSEAGPNTQAAPAAPERFVAYMFDDIHLEFGDLAHVREAAERHFATLKPTDRAAIFTTSGETILDFTDDRAKLHDTLLRLKPSPINSGNFAHQCPEISYYQADLIVNKHDNEATQVAIQEAGECGPNVQQGFSSAPQGNPVGIVNALSVGVLAAGEPIRPRARDLGQGTSGGSSGWSFGRSGYQRAWRGV